MTDDDSIPRNYGQCRECITVRCGIQLTKSYIASRLDELRNSSHPKTREFSAKYGDPYSRQIVQWFEEAQRVAP